MKKFAFVPMVAIAFAACADSPTALSTDDALLNRGGAKQGGQTAPVSNPNTPVSAVFVIPGEGGTPYYRESGAGNNGKGECRSEGRWYNPENRKTSEKPHSQCLSVSGGQTITVTFSEIANYVVAPSGNVNLNFSDMAENQDRKLQYHKNHDATDGKGTLVKVGDSVDPTRMWMIDLDQALLRGAGNLIDRTGTELKACNVDLGCFPGVMTW